MPFRSQLFPSVTWLFAAVFPWFSPFPFPVFPGFLFVSLSFLSGFPLVFPFPVFPGFPRVSLGFPWFPCRFYVVFPWFSLVLEPQENSGKTKRKLEENYRKTPEKPGKTREGENHKPPGVRVWERSFGLLALDLDLGILYTISKHMICTVSSIFLGV